MIIDSKFIEELELVTGQRIKPSLILEKKLKITKTSKINIPTLSTLEPAKIDLDLRNGRKRELRLLVVQRCVFGRYRSPKTFTFRQLCNPRIRTSQSPENTCFFAVFLPGTISTKGKR